MIPGATAHRSAGVTVAARPRTVIVMLSTLMSAACGGGGGGDSNNLINTPPPTPAPTVQISIDPTTITEGGTATITWAATNATSCTASGAWGGSQPTNGTFDVQPASDGTYNYGLSCTGAGGTAESSTALVVSEAPPSGLSYAIPSTLNILDSVAYSPTVTGNVAAYSISPTLPAGLALSASTGAISGVPRESHATETYTITAENPSGETTETVSFEIATSIRPPVSIAYTTWESVTVTRFAWEGRNVALLSESDALNPGLVEFLLDGLDKGYDYYRSALPRAPDVYTPSTYNGKIIIAEVDYTCGAACGGIGWTGIQIQRDFFQRMLRKALVNGQFDQVPFYEFGRNFYLSELDGRITYKSPDDTWTVTTGFAVLMRLLSLERMGLTPAPFSHTPGDDSQIPWEDFRSELLGMAETYINDPSYNWQNTLQVGVGVPNTMSLGSTDLFSALMYETARRYEPLPPAGDPGPDFFQKIWKIAVTRPEAVTSQDAVDNLVLAACEATQVNLTSYFSGTLRWPVSASAIQEAFDTFGGPVP